MGKQDKKVKEMHLNRDEIDASATMGAREEPDLQSDKFGPKEAKKIVKMVVDDVTTGYNTQAEWLTVKKRELQHIAAEKPSDIENLKKRSWMSDRNLGLMPGILDIYQATLLSTCYNPDSINFIAVETNDIDNRDNLAKFTKWGLGDAESKFFNEVDDYISNKTAHGFSCFHVYWEVKYQWVEKRIPQYSKRNKKVVVGYEKKTEHRRFERGVIKNIDNIDDILIPTYGKDIQDLSFFVEIVHYTFNDLNDKDDMGMLERFDKDEFYKRFRAGIQQIKPDDIRHRKLELTKLQEVDNGDTLANTVLDMYLWHGEYEKDGKREKYQFLIEPISETLFFGKPIRKLNRSGRIPYVGGPLRKTPGQLRGGSLVMLVAPVINALNNNYNQTSDYQYVENIPFGFADLAELGIKGMEELEPGKLFNIDSLSGSIKDKVFFPNLTRNLAWSYQDKNFLMEIIERLTGAASYFLTTGSNKATATRDAIINEKSETKFGLWVKRIMVEICEAVNMWLELYQDNAPVTLGERILGEDGQKLFDNLSIDDLRGRYRPQMVPDITHGSKAYKQRLALWGLTQLQQGSIWFHPEINPRGNWKLTEDAMKEMGYIDAIEYLPPMPKAKIGSSQEVKNEFQKIKQGDVLNPPPEGVTPAVMEHWAGHLRQKKEQYNEIPEEYRPNFDAHLFATYTNMIAFVQKKQEERIINQVAQQSIANIQNAATSQKPSPMAPNPANMAPGGTISGQPGGMPGGTEMTPQKENVAV